MKAADNAIKRAMQALGAENDKQFAAAIGVAPPTVSGYRTRGSLPLEQCIKVCDLAGVSLDWLIRGIDISLLNKKLALSEPPTNYKQNSATEIPLYDVPASAGNGSFFEDERVVQQVPFNQEWLHREGLYKNDLVCLPIKGDSMLPSLIDGDIVLVNRAVQHGDGVFVLRMNNALRIKRLQWLANGDLRISSDNPIYNEEIVDPDKLDEFEIIGACHTKIGRVV